MENFNMVKQGEGILMKLKGIALIILLALSGMPLGAQTGNQELTVEDIYLNSTVEVQIVRALAQESSRKDKERALNILSRMIDENKVTEGSVDVIFILEELSGEGVAKEVRINRALANDYSEVRRKSAELLGQVGGKRAVETLITMTLKDPEPTVVAEAIYSLGLLGGDDTGEAEKVIAHVMRIYNMTTRIDNNLAFAAISAIEKIGKTKSGRIRPELFSILTQIQNSNYIRAVKKKAERVLDEMRTY